MRIATVFLTFFLAGGAVALAGSEDDMLDLSLSAARNIAAGRYDDGQRALERAMKSYPNAPDIDLVYGLLCKAYAGKKGFDQAITFCSAAILRNPNNPAYLAERANAYYWTGERVAARRDADAALAQGADKAAVYGLKARLFWEEGNLAEARTACWMATRRDAREANAKFVMTAILSGKRPAKLETPSVAPSPRALSNGTPERDVQPKPKPQRPAVALGLTCRPPASEAEATVCRDAGLRRRDQLLRRQYERAFDVAANPAAMDAAQRDWIATVRNACKTKACLAAAYANREAVLRLWTED